MSAEHHAESPGEDVISVREMRPDEVGIVESHRRLAHREASRYRGGERLAEDFSVPDGTGRSGSVVVLVAVFGSSVIGSLIATRTSPREWMIVHVHVIEAAREAGAGDALMDALVGRLRSDGALWLGAHALPGDRETKNLFERQGMSARLIEVGRALD